MSERTVLIADDEDTFDNLSDSTWSTKVLRHRGQDRREARAWRERNTSHHPDIMMPELDGRVLQEIQRKARRPLSCSGKDAEMDKVYGLELGADDYVTKPFSPRTGIQGEGSSPAEEPEGEAVSYPVSP